MIGNKRGYNTDVVEVYEEYYTKLTEKLFPTKLECVTKMNQVIDADLRYSRFPGLVLYMVSHGLSMLEQKYFGRRLQNSQGRLSALNVLRNVDSDKHFQSILKCLLVKGINHQPLLILRDGLDHPLVVALRHAVVPPLAVGRFLVARPPDITT